jgi:hypothetical protein
MFMTNTTNESELRLWTKSDVAKFLQVTERHITNLMERGSLPFLKLGTPGAKRVPVRFDPEAVKAAIRKQFTQ